jgi:hypothetical protein
MMNTRLKPRPARSRVAAARVFGEYLQDQRAENPGKNRWICVTVEHESSTRSGDLRTLSPA